MIWKKDKKLDESFDPNFLTKDMYKDCNFHKMLHALIQRNSSGQLEDLPDGSKKVPREQCLPLLHIDIHGKNDEKSNLNIDLGLKAFQTIYGVADNLANDFEACFIRGF